MFVLWFKGYTKMFSSQVFLKIICILHGMLVYVQIHIADWISELWLLITLQSLQHFRFLGYPFIVRKTAVCLSVPKMSVNEFQKTSNQ